MLKRIRITVYESIADTDWRLVNLPDADFEEGYLSGLWKEVVIILIIMALAMFLF